VLPDPRPTDRRKARRASTEVVPFQVHFRHQSRQAEADAIAAAWGATTKWRDGYYMAELAFGGFVLEFHFAPLITEQDAA
jgi:hypothetical protein